MKKLNLPEKEIIELYKIKDATYISKIYGCCVSPILRILRENDILIRKNHLQLGNEIWKKRDGIKERVEIGCENCKEIFKVKYSERNQRKYCCFECYKERVPSWNTGFKGKGIYHLWDKKPNPMNGNKHSEYTKKIISESTSGVNNPNYRKKESEITRNRISKTRIERGVAKLEKNPAWKGGKSFEPYTKEFNKAFKLAIKQRDGFMCLKCGMRDEDSKILFKRGLVIHHIDYVKETTIPENCCALCNRCNIEVNINRLSWTKFFQSLLSERYGYKYSEDGDIIINLREVKNNG